MLNQSGTYSDDMFSLSFHNDDWKYSHNDIPNSMISYPKWNKLHKMKCARTSLSAVLIKTNEKEKIFVFGGFDFFMVSKYRNI